MWKSPKLCDQLIRQQRSITRYNSAWWLAGNAKCQIKCLLYLLCDGDVVIYLRSSEEKACWPPRSLYVMAALLGLGVALFSSVVLPLSPGHFLFFLSYDHKWYSGEIELWMFTQSSQELHHILFENCRMLECCYTIVRWRDRKKANVLGFSVARSHCSTLHCTVVQTP